MTTLPHFEEHPGTGPHLMMVHGFLSSRAQWRNNLAMLSRFTRPVLVELLAHGRSPAPEDDDAYQVERYMHAFEEIRERVGAQRWIVCGQSFAAGLVIRYAVTHPDRVAGVIVTNSLSAFSPPGDEAREEVRRQRMMKLAEGGRQGLAELPIHPRNAKRFPEAVKAEMVTDAERIDVAGVIKSLRITIPKLSMADRLSEITQPVLLVNGIWEKRFQPLCQNAVDSIPQLTLVELEGGHSINVEAAEGFCAAVETYVTKTLAGRFAGALA